MRSSEEFKSLINAKRNNYYEKKKYRNKKIIKYATTVTVCSFIICSVSTIWKYSGRYDGNCENARGSENIIESIQNESSEKYGYTKSLEIVGKIDNKPYNKICMDEERIKKIMEFIEPSNSQVFNDMDDSLIKEEMDEGKNNYVVITVKDNNSSPQQYSIDGEEAKKIVEVLGK